MKNSHDSITQGHCDLIGQIILGACSPKDAHDRFVNRRWARESMLLSHYCDVMHMDRQKIEEAIIKQNL